MAILLNPDTMRKAQAEIDSVVGSDGTVLPCIDHLKDPAVLCCNIEGDSSVSGFCSSNAVP